MLSCEIQKPLKPKGPLDLETSSQAGVYCARCLRFCVEGLGASGVWAKGLGGSGP